MNTSNQIVLYICTNIPVLLILTAHFCSHLCTGECGFIDRVSKISSAVSYKMKATVCAIRCDKGNGNVKNGH